MRLGALFRRLLAILLTLAFAGFAAERFRGKVVAVVDGDTISVMRSGAPVTIRLDGIDCPEGGQDFSQRAKQFTASMVFGKTVEIAVRDVDRYQRLVGRVVVNGEDVSLALVRAGLAWHYKQYSSDPLLAKAEVEARERRIGLWGQGHPIPPWEFRHPTVEAAASVAGPFHGNVRSRVFHRPGCPNYDCKNCTQVFRTKEDAIAAGFRPAGDCLR